MAVYLGSNTLADPSYEPEGFEESAVDVGGIQTMADGSQVYDYVATRLRFNMRWRGITTTQKDAIRTAYLVKTAQTFTPSIVSGSATYSVFVVPNSWRAKYVEDGGATKRWDCEMAVEEVS